MDIVVLLSIIAALGYGLAAGLQWLALKHRMERHPWVRASIGTALLAQALAIGASAQQVGITFGFFQVGAIITWMVMLILWVSDFKRPVASLYLGLGPIAALAILVRIALPNTPMNLPDTRLWVHILLSLLAYGMLTVAAVQATIVLIQDRSLHSGHPTLMIRALPPLQTMDKLLVQFILFGMGLLTVAIATGFYFLDDMFAQHVAHKTILSLIAWLLFTTLLVGRKLRGWRGALASKWTLAGFAVLMLAFFGSKFVLELLLKRT